MYDMLHMLVCRSLMLILLITITSAVLIDGLQRELLAPGHGLVPASSTGLLYHGRWIYGVDYAITAFSSASLEFSISNATTIFLDLHDKLYANSTKEGLLGQFLDVRHKHEFSSGLLSLIVDINEGQDVRLCVAGQGILGVVDNLDPGRSYNMRVSLASTHGSCSTFALRGVWLSKGASLITTSSPRLKHVDVLVPGSFLGVHDIVDNYVVPWPVMLQSHFDYATMSILPLQHQSCLTKACRKYYGDHPTIRSQFFRSGPPNTTLFARPWPFCIDEHYRAIPPKAVILVLGLSDFESLLSRSPLPSRRGLESFLGDFTHAYSQLIQMVRPTAYSGYSAIARSGVDPQASISGSNSNIYHSTLKASHTYISASSTVPIFLVVPPLPSRLLYSKSRALRKLMYHAITAVIGDLKFHIGDKRTFFVSTDEWLTDNDFVLVSSDNATSGQGEFRLAQTGHIKFAYRMSEELCWWLAESEAGRKSCPFERHDEYMGDLHVPDSATVDKMLEDRKIGGIMERLNMT